MTESVDRVQKVLIIDDNDDLRELQKLLLKPTYSVETAECGMSGLETLDHSTDVVLLDRNMPGLSGTETAVAIRESEYNPAVAIVSANPADTDIFKIPCDAYLEKPVKQPDLISTVEELLSRALHDSTLREFLALESKHRALRKSTFGNCHTDEFKESVRKLKSLEKQLAGNAVTGNSAVSD
ncbi:response regulator [Halohasta litorea]|uniref:Response regulator n=1 Tax=Halohasta litorea TaxID=869891 RepID=A0ABD6DEC5_9EURY|nr:response regulator [Halohasta litorea]